VSNAAIRKQTAVGEEYMEQARALVAERLGATKSLLTEAECARVLGLARMTIYRQRELGNLAYFRFGKRVKYGLYHIADFLRSQENRAR
jgi:predicted DNA-binding transcriptional regulator AlpA